MPSGSPNKLALDAMCRRSSRRARITASIELVDGTRRGDRQLAEFTHGRFAMLAMIRASYASFSFVWTLASHQ